MLMAENEEEIKSLLMRVKEKNDKASLKLSIQKTKIMAPGSMTSWQMNRETMETVTDFIWGGGWWTPKSLRMVTADGDCSHEML